MDLSDLARSIQDRLDAKNAAREHALPAARRSIRASANAIRAIHRLEFDTAKTLIGESRQALDEGLAAVRDHADIRHAGYLQDAQKEYAEANLTMALVTGTDLPGPQDLDVEDAAYLGGMSDAIGEGRRRLLDLLREGEVHRAEQLLDAMEEMFGVLVTMDYPDAITIEPATRHRCLPIPDREDTWRPVDLGCAERPPRCARSPHRSAPREGWVVGTLCYAARRPGGVAQPGRALPSHGRGQGFKSPHLHHLLGFLFGIEALQR